MPGKNPGPSIKKPALYEKLKEQGYSKEKAAAVSNAQAKDERRDESIKKNKGKKAPAKKK